ncbi:MAG: hypothetical protein F4Z35_05630 [Dehalococcoidia bacterium]|nr:hypothetical protein [Dehalococcoidia bacterium]MYA02261.1 hypothetical protein [Chloroflexota bacterium]
MPNTRTVFLPDDWPISIDLDAWALVGSGKATSTSGQTGQWAQRTSDDPERPPDRYQIDIYRAGDQYVIAGTSTDPHQNMTRTNVVGAIRTVAADLSVDAAVQGVLIQDVLGSLDPEPLT